MAISKKLLEQYKGQNVRVSVFTGGTSDIFSSGGRFIGVLLEVDDKFIKIEESYGRLGAKTYLINIDYIISVRLA